ncbi:hypothetical protein AB1Y20_018525 [Prymnesium parvum]|uniref:Tubulin--tyrosine ligase-like protein 9 n=1 Tax=Prymnesium parvum TaxID=97485 RepID=A0AB34JNH7_PRYPA
MSDEEEAEAIPHASWALAGRSRRTSLRTTPAPTVINVSQCKYGSVRKAAQQIGWSEARDGSPWHIYWTDLSVSHDRVRELGPLQKLNHFPDMTVLCHKASSADILKRMRRYFPREYHFFPKSWSLPRDLGPLHKHLSAPVAPGAPAPTVILKPNKGCQGASISVVRSVAELEAVRASEPASASWVAQEYIDRPLLVDGFKFDMRIYVLITCIMPLRVYLFQDGIARLCTQKYSSAEHISAQPPPLGRNASANAVSSGAKGGGACAPTVRRHGSAGAAPRGGSADVRRHFSKGCGGAPRAASAAAHLLSAGGGRKESERRRGDGTAAWPPPRLLPFPGSLPPPQARRARRNAHRVGLYAYGDGGGQETSAPPAPTGGERCSAAASPRASMAKYEGDWRFGHLTNYTINKVHPDFHAGEGGSKRTLAQTFELLAKRNIDTEQLWDEISEVVVKTVIAVQPDVAHSYARCRPAANAHPFSCFELLGLDLLVDEDAKPWLLEVNHSPSLACDTEVDRQLKERLLSDTMRICSFSIAESRCLRRAMKGEVRVRASQPAPAVRHARDGRRLTSASRAMQTVGAFEIVLSQRQKVAQEASNERRQKTERLLAFLHSLRAEYEEANSNGFTQIFPTRKPKVYNTYELLLLSSQRAFEEESCTRTMLSHRPLLPAEVFHMWRDIP